MSFDKIFDLTDGLYFYFKLYVYVPNPGSHDSLPRRFIASEYRGSDPESHNKVNNGNQTLRYQQIRNLPAEIDGWSIAHADSGYLAEHDNVSSCKGVK